MGKTKEKKYEWINESIMGTKVVMYVKCLACEHIWTPRFEEKTERVLKKEPLLCPTCKRKLEYGGKK